MSVADAWDPERYELFASERAQPFHDLVGMVDAVPAMRVLDLGCGTGELTRSLHETLRASATVGVDRSRGMLQRAVPGPSLRFVHASIEELPLGGPFDLVFSNAALHWVEDHAGLLARLRDLLSPGGQIAVQVPANHDQAPHRSAEDVAGEEPFATALRGHRRRVPVLEPIDYARILEGHGYRGARVWLRVYGHRLESREDVVEWTRGTLLTDYLERLPPRLQERFTDRFREVLLARLPDERPFFFPFQRILFHARRGE